MIKHLKTILSFGIIWTFLSLCPILAQTDSSGQDSYLLNTIRYEKVYLHTDRDIYSSKDIIWFKIYLLNGHTRAPIAGPNNVYVDLVGQNGQVIIHKPYFAFNGLANGNFAISDSLETGIYTMYAYTNYMRNFGTDAFFKKEITISKISVDKNRQVISGQPEVPVQAPFRGSPPGLQFMPEGGYLSQGIVNILAFKILAPNGKGINLNGAVFDQNNRFVDSISAKHLGMGKFLLIPKTATRYYALLNGFPLDTFWLPAAQEGPQLHYIGLKDSILQFKLTDLSNHNSGRSFYIAAKAKGNFLFYAEKALSEYVGLVNINQRNFKPGINQVFLLDHDLQPLSERLIYLPGNSMASLEIAVKKNVYFSREKTNVTLQLGSAEDIAAGGSFSLTVVNLDHKGSYGISQNNIISWLELDSEIRGEIENPAYYFSQPFDSVKKELDLLLLTQGWRKYIWDKSYLDSLPVFNHKSEIGFPITGKAQRLLTKGDLNDGNIFLFIPDEQIFEEAITGEDGRFYFENLVLFDSTRIAVQSRTKNFTKNTRLVSADYQVTPPPVFPSLPMTKSLANLVNYNRKVNLRYISNSYINFDTTNIFLDEVSVFHKRVQDDGHSRIYSDPANVIEMDDYPTYQNMDIFSFLQGRVSGLLISGQNISIRGSIDAPHIILDGMPIDIELARDIPLSEVDKIEVLKDPVNTSIFGVLGANGVIAIYSKTGEINFQDTPIQDIIVKKVEGFGIPKEFYSPDYSSPEASHAAIDLRTTLYWAPNLVPDSSGECTISYYNSDDTGNIAIIAEGVLNNGKPGVVSAGYYLRKR